MGVGFHFQSCPIPPPSFNHATQQKFFSLFSSFYKALIFNILKKCFIVVIIIYLFNKRVDCLLVGEKKVQFFFVVHLQCQTTTTALRCC